MIGSLKSSATAFHRRSQKGPPLHIHNYNAIIINNDIDSQKARVP